MVGGLTFFAATNSDLSSSARQIGEPVIVPANTVDALAQAHFDAPVDLIKCDLEGGEMAVLRGTRGVRNAETPPIWMLEAAERFLTETGSSYDALEDEVGSAREPIYEVLRRAGPAMVRAAAFLRPARNYSSERGPPTS